MIKNHRHLIHVDSKMPPVVELDSAAHAAYVRFSNAKVKKTVVVDVKRQLITMDVDATGEVVGVELIGVKEFKIETLIKKAGITGVSPAMLRNTSYVPANAELVA